MFSLKHCISVKDWQDIMIMCKIKLGDNMRGDSRIKYLQLITMITVLVQDPGLLDGFAHACQRRIHQTVRWFL